LIQKAPTHCAARRLRFPFPHPQHPSGERILARSELAGYPL